MLVKGFFGPNLQELLSSSATVTVEVVDINDNNPTFQRESFTAEIQETAIPGIRYCLDK
jgi:hypothetical protein